MARRTAEDYGVPDLDDAALARLAGTPGFGEKSRFAGRELGARRGLLREADMYRAALERAAYGDVGRQLGRGVGSISNRLGGMGPLAEGGAQQALRARLASQLFGDASSRVGSSYADFLGRSIQGRRQFRYQQALQRQAEQASKPGFWGTLGGIVGGIAGNVVPGLSGPSPKRTQTTGAGGYDPYSDAIYG